MLDLNILKWSWSQRLLAISYIITFRMTILKPYASLTNEFTTKQFPGALNLMCWATVLLLFVAMLYCYGCYHLKYKNFMYSALGCIGVNAFFLIVSFSKDRRLPTGSYLLSILCVLITCGIIWYDATAYQYYEK